jgi:hypothetical protein
MSVACFMTSITTAVGFGTLVISETPILRRFGLVAAGAVMLTYVVTVVFLPTALATFAGPVARTRTATKSRLLDAFVGRLSTWSTTRPAWIVAFAVGLMILCVPAAWGVRVDGALLDQFESSSDVIQTTRAVERHLGGIRTLSVGARARRGSMLDPERLETLDVIAEGLRREEGVLRVTTPGDVLRETWSSVIAVDDETATDALTARPRIDALAALGRAGEAGRAPALDRFATRDGRLARIEVRLADLGVRHINGVIDRLESRLSHTETLDTFIAGEAYRASRGLDRVMTDLAWSLALAVLVILASIGVLFRSPRLALVSVLPNLLPLAAVAGWMGLRNIPLHAATVIVFGVSIGLAVDGTIHVISRYREELSIERAMAGSGRAIILSSGALILGFLALQVSGFVPIRRFGELSIVAILAAVVADLTLLPALLSLSSRVHT